MDLCLGLVLRVFTLPDLPRVHFVCLDHSTYTECFTRPARLNFAWGPPVFPLRLIQHPLSWGVVQPLGVAGVCVYHLATVLQCVDGDSFRLGVLGLVFAACSKLQAWWAAAACDAAMCAYWKVCLAGACNVLGSPTLVAPFALCECAAG